MGSGGAAGPPAGGMGGHNFGDFGGGGDFGDFGDGDFGDDATRVDPQHGLGGDYQGEDYDPFVGMVLNDRFTIEAKLGEGGFGAVYRGFQSGTGRKVAIKVLHPDVSRDENLVQRFRREGLVLCNLRDAHTVTTYDFDQTPDGMLYIAMELLEGRSLHDLFKDEAPIEWKRMFKITAQMCSSLAEAHAQGIVHRDLKPENIYLENRPGNSEFVKILDFGIAKITRGDSLSGQNPQLTATGQTLGTLEYMSPEQLMGKELDGRSDVYALGVLVYELVSGRLPFPDAKGPAGLITAQLRQTPEPLSKAHPGGNIPPSVDQLVLKMLGKDKADRYNDVSELREELNRIMYQADAQPSAPATPQPGSGMQRPPGSGSMPMGQKPAFPNPNMAPNMVGPGPGNYGGQPGNYGGQPGMPPGQPGMPPGNYGQPGNYAPPGNYGQPGPGGYGPAPGQPGYGHPGSYPGLARVKDEGSSSLWLWIVLVVVLIGGGVGVFLLVK